MPRNKDMPPRWTRKDANRDFLSWVCRKVPPDDLIPEESWSKLDEIRSAKLQDFVVEHSRAWASGIGLLEAMDS